MRKWSGILSGQNPGRRVNDSVMLSGEKDTEVKGETACCYSSFVCHFFLFPLGPGVDWRRAFYRLVVIVNKLSILLCAL